ncbi:MAG: VOC family protein [Myxococcota bacterium]|nr:VOC family protein [Myxococcota bacterium]
MIDHIGIQVADLAKSIAFYQQALAPLGYTLIMNIPNAAAGFGAGGKPDLWIGPGKPEGRAHVAIQAKGRAEVRAFHAAALAAGGRDNGAPGVRALYHPDYYGAFVLDPDGHNLEAVCHEAYLG